ncbi:MAG: hypothetical protein K1Y02_04420 [Candidatus Hydrogenedentes bacterium]|nr:hypothetical protein [Candidatus Hydrogenedentota bacterium]
MPSLNDLERLAQRAKQDVAPSVSVAGHVIATLAENRSAPSVLPILAMRSFALAASFSAAIAAPAAYLVFYLDSVASDPWIDLLYAVTGGVL